MKRASVGPSAGWEQFRKSRIKMLEPTMGPEGVKEFVVQTVKEAGGNPCPPVIVGVGIGGTFEKAALLAKQALLDAGKLPPADEDHTDEASRIRLMQWQWGIGVDCAGYTQQAAAAVHGPAGAAFKDGLMGDIFSGMKNDPRFRRIDVADIRPGDVIHLDNPKKGAVGHNVIVYDRTILDSKKIAELLAHQPKLSEEARVAGLRSAAEFFCGKGPFHVLKVDSSWGAGNGNTEVGGYRRDQWIYDEGSKTWASFPGGKRELALESDPRTGPQRERFGGAFRPREAP